MNKTSRRKFGKQLTGALAALPVASFVTASPTAAQSKDQSKAQEGSPITVGGGGGIGETKRFMAGVGLIFNHGNGHYPDPKPGKKEKKKFKNNNWSMRKLKLAIGAQVFDFSDDLPSNGDCTIEITCARNDDDIKIEGKPLSVEFNTSKYEELADPNAHAYDTHITQLKIDAPNFYYEREFAQGTIWELRVDWA